MIWKSSILVNVIISFVFITLSICSPLIQTRLNTNLWGLDILDSSFDDYYYYNLTGKGVNVYIVDSGIDISHREFNGRMQSIYSTTNEKECISTDDKQHGTHVAGIIGGETVGVAKEVNLFSVQVIKCDNKTSINDIYNGLEWILKNHKKPAIVNLSMGSTTDAVEKFIKLEQIIDDLIKSGVIFIRALGNFDSVNGCLSSPSNIPGVINVAASNRNFKKSSFSNWGSCVHFYAPGESIYSSYPNNQYAIMSGTSQAAPFVSGVVALYLEQHPTANWTEIVSALQNSSIKNSIADTKTNDPTFFIQSIYINSSSSSSNLTNAIIWIISIIVFIILISIFSFVYKKYK